MSDEPRRFARELFGVSVLKQAKLRQIADLLGDTRGLTCLDVGGDNGVVSLMLRERGGIWHSADLDDRTVESIRELVGENVVRIDGRATPFAAASFDRIVVVDFLEHIPTDREFVRELRRILREGGRLLVNVPHVKPRSLLNRLRHAAGMTDEAHGHVRPGYTLEGLREVLAPDFEVIAHRTYSRAFSEGIDTAMGIVWAVMASRGGGAPPSAKGNVVTRQDRKRHGTGFRLLAALYPALRAVASLDRLLVLQDGYKLLVEAQPRVSGGAVAVPHATSSRS